MSHTTQDLERFISIMTSLAANDDDRAEKANAIGFNKPDSMGTLGDIAHTLLAIPEWLTNADYDYQADVLKLCYPKLAKYRRQIGDLWDENYPYHNEQVDHAAEQGVSHDAKVLRHNRIEFTIAPHRARWERDSKETIGFRFPFDLKYVFANDETKSQLGLSWDGNDKTWYVTKRELPFAEVERIFKEAVKVHNVTVAFVVSQSVRGFQPIQPPAPSAVDLLDEECIYIMQHEKGYYAVYTKYKAYGTWKDLLKSVGADLNSKPVYVGEDKHWAVRDYRVISVFTNKAREIGGIVKFDDLVPDPAEADKELAELVARINGERYAIMESVFIEGESRGVILEEYQKLAVQRAITDGLGGKQRGFILAPGTGTGKTPMSSAATRILMEHTGATFVIAITTMINKTKVAEWFKNFGIQNVIVSAWSTNMPYVQAWCEVYEPYKTQNRIFDWVNCDTGKSENGWSVGKDKSPIWNATKFRLVIPQTASNTTDIHWNGGGYSAKFKKAKINNKPSIVSEDTDFILVVDEAHRSSKAFGGGAAKQAIKTSLLSRASRYCLQTTATPFSNGSAANVYALAERTGLALGTYNGFIYEHCILEGSGRNVTHRGIKYPSKLAKILAPIMYKVKTTKVLEGLPPVVISRTDIDENDDEINEAIFEYYKTRDALLMKYSERGGTIIPLTELMAIRQAASKTKLPAVIQAVTDLINEGEKVVVYSPFKETINALYTALSTAENGLSYVDDQLNERQAFLGLISGDTKAIDRAKLADTFQTIEGAAIMLINDAGSESVDLNAARYEIIVDLDWRVSTFEQVAGRIIRRGSEVHDHIKIIVIVFPEMDDALWYNITKKLSDVYAFDAGEDIYVSHGIQSENVKVSQIAMAMRRQVEVEDKHDAAEHVLVGVTDDVPNPA